MPRQQILQGECCDGGCAFDDARVWTSDDCTTDEEHTLITALPLQAELLRVSINGQQYSAAYPHDDAPSRPHTWSGLPTAVPGFTYYDSGSARLRLSAVTPMEGPVAGGTLVTLTGLGFADLGARVGFLSAANGTADDGTADGNLTVVTVPASIAFGAFRGRALTCRTPPSLGGAVGEATVELSLNGEALPPAMSSGSELRFVYVAETAVDDPGSGAADSGSGELGSGAAGESGSGGRRLDAGGEGDGDSSAVAVSAPTSSRSSTYDVAATTSATESAKRRSS